MSKNSGYARWLSLAACLILALSSGCGAGGVSEPANSNVHINGVWNVELTTGTSGATPQITFGLTLTQTGAVVNGVIAPYTGSTPAVTNCLVFTGLTAQGNVNQSSVTLTVTDPGSSSSLSITGSADNSVSSIGGTFNTRFGSANGQPACQNINGTATLRKQ